MKKQIKLSLLGLALGGTILLASCGTPVKNSSYNTNDTLDNTTTTPSVNDTESLNGSLSNSHPSNTPSSDAIPSTNNKIPSTTQEVPSQTGEVTPSQPSTTTNSKPTTPSETTIINPNTTTVVTNPTTTTSGNIDQTADIVVTAYNGYNEGAYIEFNKLNDITTYVASYSTDGTNYIKADDELVREIEDGKYRVDFVGLAVGNYTIKVTASTNTTTYTTQVLSVTVSPQDRSGYAFFNCNLIGAYQTNGLLQSNAQVIYVTNANKNTVTATFGGKTYTGLVEIIQNSNKSSNPVDIRILDTIKTNQWEQKSCSPRLVDNSNLQLQTFWDNTFETKYGDNLKGLTVKYMDKYECKGYKYFTTASGLTENAEVGNSSKKTTTYGRSDYPNITGKTVYDDDSYWNMLDVSNAKNITIEGIGSDAGCLQWGFTWNSPNKVEVKNLTFTDYPEDACSFESNSVTEYGNIWLHNCTFNRGKNNWDVSGERDKYAGDGATDLKKIHNITSSYNKFTKCKKTGLVGGGDSDPTMNITFHHNFYDQVESRLPLGRQANMHFYNNYYYKCSTCQDIRANAFVFSEANYFDGCKNPQLVTTSSTYSGTVIKSYNDYLTGCGTSKATVVTSRTKALSGNCKPDTKTDYTNFDTNSSLFYYNATSQTSNVARLTTAANAKTDCENYAGANKKATGAYLVDQTTPSTPSSGTTTPSTGTTTPSGSTTTTPSTSYTPQNNAIYLNFNNFTEEQITQDVTKDNITLVYNTSSKALSVKSATNTVANQSLTKYVSFSGGGSYSGCAIRFSVTATAKITVYYAATAGRYLNLLNSTGVVQTSDATVGSNTIQSYSYQNVSAGTYAIASKGSGINVYLIVIEY